MKKVLISMLLVVLTLCLFVSCSDEPKEKDGKIYMFEQTTTISKDNPYIIVYNGNVYCIYYGDSLNLYKTYKYDNYNEEQSFDEKDALKMYFKINKDKGEITFITKDNGYEETPFVNRVITNTSITDGGLSFKYNGETYTVNPNTPS